MASPQPGPDGRADAAAEGGAEDRGGVHAEPQHRVRRLQLRGRHCLRGQRRGGREADGGDRAVDGAERGQQGDARSAGEDGCGDDGLGEGTGERRADQDQSAGQAVGDDASHQQQRHVGDGSAGRDEAEGSGAVTHVEDREGERHGRHGVAEQRHAAGGQQEPERAMAKWAGRGDQAGPRASRKAPAGPGACRIRSSRSSCQSRRDRRRASAWSVRKRSKCRARRRSPC